ncbi:pyridoxamine 5'-phosphate oxidase family protein [Pseudoflavitalea sp. X16]|uniref:pyridoxamine 5'-phosphate oxidase family protein n=1 Tax=Paraflavitalea devenefica TaxID=2716334 RepID=UPI00142331BA|nr:pyridoxamine 5'-phosphate oxidase family protein [Paraflavitalea devenefica]NII27795.1 pyridoxamine 5'-phosphate oxidase family protein [Paraflavitalea devenefica]
MFGNLSPAEIENVLSRQVVGRIGCHAEGITYVVPISFAYDGQFVYCYTQEGMKVTLMRQNPQVCFQTDELENMANWKSVIAWGSFEELPQGRERREALDKLRDRVLPMVSSERVRQSADWPFTNNITEPVPGVVFRIRLTKKTGRFEKSTQSALLA